jgi:Ca2+-binding EF-hand superfamily protein
MSKLVAGALVMAALFPTNVAAAESASVALPSSAAHSHHSFFTSNQARADIPAHVERLFKTLDSNHDGFVTRSEIAALQAEFDERAAKGAPKRAERMFNRLDADHDGKITIAEAAVSRTARTRAGKASGHRGSALFARADGNKDGAVTRAEFDAAVANGKIKLHHASMRGSQIVRLFDSADAGKQGRISLEEAEQAELRQFDAADQNHDGVLTPQERRQAARSDRVRRPTT